MSLVCYYYVNGETREQAGSKSPKIGGFRGRMYTVAQNWGVGAKLS